MKSRPTATHDTEGGEEGVGRLLPGEEIVYKW